MFEQAQYGHRVQVKLLGKFGNSGSLLERIRALGGELLARVVIKVVELAAHCTVIVWATPSSHLDTGHFGE